MSELPSLGNISSFSGELPSFRKVHADKIRDTFAKFNDDQKAVLVLHGVPFPNQAIEAADNWRRSRENADRIKAVIIIGRLNSAEGYTRKTHTYFLEDDPGEMEKFLKSFG